MDTSPQTNKSPFLALPYELRTEIYQHLLTPITTLTLRCLFIRKDYRNVFMTQQPKDICTALLRVCRQITHETLPILYAHPHWRCACRMENLALQIGIPNFALTTHLAIDPDDLPTVATCLDIQRHGSRAHAPLLPPTTAGLRFARLETLEVEGFQAAALDASLGTRRMRVEALRLCELARRILASHPQLTCLLQRGPAGDGGADARDLSWGRVRWRFVTSRAQRREGEHPVDLPVTREALQFCLDEDPAPLDTTLPVALRSFAY